MILCNDMLITVEPPGPRFVPASPPYGDPVIVLPVVGPRGADGSGASEAVKFTKIAGTILSGHRVVLLDPAQPGEVVLASCDDLESMNVDLLLTTQAALAGSSVIVLALGLIEESGWGWAPGPIWLGLNGALTQVQPQPPDAAFLRQVGSAAGPSALFFNPQPAIAF